MHGVHGCNLVFVTLTSLPCIELIVKRLVSGRLTRVLLNGH